ncbi:hypothetical protein ACOSP7_029605 [Xanthoceras sorbifolium]
MWQVAYISLIVISHQFHKHNVLLCLPLIYNFAGVQSSCKESSRRLGSSPNSVYRHVETGALLLVQFQSHFEQKHLLLFLEFFMFMSMMHLVFEPLPHWGHLCTDMDLTSVE